MKKLRDDFLRNFWSIWIAFSRILYIVARRSLGPAGGSVVGPPVQTSTHTICGGEPQLRSTYYPFNFVSPIRCAGPPVDPRGGCGVPRAPVPICVPPSATVPTRATPIQSAGPQLRSACHPSSAARSLFQERTPNLTIWRNITNWI